MEVETPKALQISVDLIHKCSMSICYGKCIKSAPYGTFCICNVYLPRPAIIDWPQVHHKFWSIETGGQGS